MADTFRGTILERAKALTEGDRNNTYGDPLDNMEALAHCWTGYLRSRNLLSYDQEIDAVDAAWMMVLTKCARTRDRDLPFHRDNYDDGAAYTAMAGECHKRLYTE